MAKKKIDYGTKDVLSEDDFRNPKIRITIYIDGDTLDAFKAQAARKKTKYQTLINEELREAANVFGKSAEEVIERLSPKELQKIRRMIAHAEANGVLKKEIQVSENASEKV